MPENLLLIITLTHAPPPSFFLSSFFFEFVIGEFEVKRVYPHCAFNELQKQNEMEDSDYTNLQVHVLTKNQTTKKSTKEFYFSKCNTTHRKKCCELQF